MFFLLEKKGAVIIGNNLHDHIWWFFVLSFFLSLLTTLYGYLLFCVFLFFIDFFFKFYVFTFEKHSNIYVDGFFFIEIQSDLVFRISFFFLVVFLIQTIVITTIRKNKYLVLIFMVAAITFYIPNFSDAWNLVFSFVSLDFILSLKKANTYLKLHLVGKFIIVTKLR